VKPRNDAPSGEMFPRYVQSPWMVVSTDIMGPFPRSSKGNLYILAFQDVFSKWIELIPIRKATANIITSKFCAHILCRYGAPRVLISDNAKNFISTSMQDLSKAYGITHQTIPHYHSQANPVERANRNTKQLITSYLENDHQKWDEYLSEIQFALNSVVQDSTGFSPAFLNFGRELKPFSSLRTEVSGSDDIPSLEVSQENLKGWAKRIAKLKEFYHIAEDHMLKASTVQSHRYNLRRRAVKYKAGDMVLRKSFQLSSAVDKKAAKLYPKFEGPYIVDEVSKGGSCWLKTRSGKRCGLWHPSKLKPYKSNQGRT